MSWVLLCFRHPSRKRLTNFSSLAEATTIPDTSTVPPIVWPPRPVGNRFVFITVLRFELRDLYTNGGVSAVSESFLDNFLSRQRHRLHCSL